jgi:hypothetical protein
MSLGSNATSHEAGEDPYEDGMNRTTRDFLLNKIALLISSNDEFLSESDGVQSLDSS